MKSLCVTAIAIWVAGFSLPSNVASGSVSYVPNGKCKNTTCAGIVENTCAPSGGGCAGVCVQCQSTTIGDICITGDYSTTCIVSDNPSQAYNCGNKIDVACVGANCTCSGVSTPTATPCTVKYCISS